MNSEVSKASIPCQFYTQYPICVVQNTHYLVAEQWIQDQLFEQETKLKSVLIKLDAKVNKTYELYDLCVHLLKGGGIHFPNASSTGLALITPSKPKEI